MALETSIRKNSYKKNMGLPRYVYALVDPRDNQIRYVGCSLDPIKRLRDHMNAANSYGRSWSNSGRYQRCQPRFRWLNSLSDSGLKPRIIILEKCSGDCWRDKENDWIQHYLDAGIPLVNVKAPSGEDHYTHECFLPGKERYLLSENSRVRIERHIKQLKCELSEETSKFKREYIKIRIDYLSNILRVGAG